MTPRLLPTAPITDPRLRMKAIGLMVLATMCFAGLDATAKYLVTAKAVPVWQITWLRFVGHIAFSALALWPFAFRPSLRSKKPLVQIIRSLIMIVTTGFNFVALQYLQLDQTVTIFFLAPLLVALLGLRLGGLPLAALAGGCFLFIAVFGQWTSAMLTLASVLVAVPLGVLGGLLLGIAGHRWPRFGRAMVPFLDLMQTIPVFAYLVPILILFGFGPTSAMIATLIYAMPPMTRIWSVMLRPNTAASYLSLPHL